VPTVRAALIEYAISVPPLAVAFDLNPTRLSRSRSVQLSAERPPGSRGYDFTTPADVAQVAQGVSVQPEQFTIEVLFDATDRMSDRDPVALAAGIEPELDVLRTMLEPRTQGPGGLRLLARLSATNARAFQRDQSASVLLFVWGSHVLPVFLTNVRVDETAHLPTLVPYRADVSLTMQVIEGRNPFWRAEQVRRALGAALHTPRTVDAMLGSLQ
jgi:hypothetical protein